MKASQITPGKNVEIQTRTDARRILTTQWALDQWIAEYGDCDVVYTTHSDYPQWGYYYLVPSLQDQINRFREGKEKAMARYGCE